MLILQKLITLNKIQKQNLLINEMRKLKIQNDSTDNKDSIKNYEKHLLNYFKGKTHEY